MTLQSRLVRQPFGATRLYGRGHNRVWLPTGSPPRDRYLTREELDALLEQITTPHVRLNARAYEALQEAARERSPAT